MCTATYPAIMTLIIFFILQKWALHIILIVHYIPFYFIPTDPITQSSKILPLPKALLFHFYLWKKDKQSLAPPFIYIQRFYSHNRFGFRDHHLLVYHTENLRHQVPLTFNVLPLYLRFIYQYYYWGFLGNPQFAYIQ